MLHVVDVDCMCVRMCVCVSVCVSPHRASQSLDKLVRASAELPPDPITKPGTGLGVYSPGFKNIANHSVEVRMDTRLYTHGDAGRQASTCDCVCVCLEITTPCSRAHGTS